MEILVKRGLKMRWKLPKNWPYLKRRGKNFGGAFLDVFHRSESESAISFLQKTLVRPLSADYRLVGFDCPRLYYLQARCYVTSQGCASSNRLNSNWFPSRLLSIYPGPFSGLISIIILKPVWEHWIQSVLHKSQSISCSTVRWVFARQFGTILS